MQVQCCCCGQVRNEAGGWEYPPARPEIVSHSYCEPCFAQELHRLAEFRAFLRAETAAA